MIERTYVAAIAFAVLALSAGCGQSQPEQPAPAADITMTVEAASAFPGPLTGQPQLSSSDRGVILSWVEQTEKGALLKYAEHTSGTWSSPKTAASGADWFVNDADVPSVMRLGNNTLVASWLQETDARLEAYNLWLAYSKDDGVTWSRPIAPHHDGTKTQHGFASLFAAPSGVLGVVWLDGRQFELEPDAPGGGAMSLRATTFDQDWKQGAEAPVSTRVCECCQTSAAVTADGPIVAYRGRTEKEIRDIYVSRLEQGAWSTPVSVHADNWEVLACPVNGPAIAARGRTVAVAWFTAVNDEYHAWLARSSDAGRTWSTPVRLNDGESLGRVDVELLDDGSAVASYVDMIDGRGQLRLRRVDASLKPSPPVVAAGTGSARISGFPHLARSGNNLILAWNETATEIGAGGSVSGVHASVVRLDGGR
ncbi:MAG: sialidase family protein [Vicinamibacterales bacterium]